MKCVQGKGRQICWNVVELRELFCHQHDGDSFELVHYGCFLFLMVGCIVIILKKAGVVIQDPGGDWFA